jgi:RNA polymerase sigma factor (sigma-70 family)
VQSARVAARADDLQRRRNADLLAELIANCGVLLLRQAQKHSQLPDDAEEALQSGFALFIERYTSRGEPLAWLQTTIKREAWRIGRRAHRRREVAITAAPRRDGKGTVDLSDAFADSAAGPDERAEAHDHDERRRGAINDVLKTDERIALLLFGMGYSYAEIAQLREWSMTKVNRCLVEGRARLRASENCPPR